MLTRLLLVASVGLLGISAAWSAALPAMQRAQVRGPAHPVPVARTTVHRRFVVAFAPRTGPVARQAALDRAGAPQGLRTRIDHQTVGGHHVVLLSRAIEPASARTFMARLRTQPGVIDVEPDGRLRVSAIVNDPLFPQQWNLASGQVGVGGLHVDQAWDRATGAGVLVAVLDTGIVPHPDLDAHVLPGRDFVTDLAIAGDGDGRDADPTDPGDWNSATECDPAQPERGSSWHGTHMAGIVAALTNNGLGVAGIAHDAKVLPLRVLGHCGGWSTDIADAILWAAGGAVAGMPANPSPVDVVSLSLGGEEPCIAPLQSAIDAANAAGVVVVVSAGNGAGADVSGFAPANCRGVVVVGASDGYGDPAWYSNLGTGLDLMAPGGTGGAAILSTHNSGTSTVGAPIYTGFQGTSPATAEVAAIAALMQSVAPATPADVEAVLAGTASRQLLCLDSVCGAGVANAKAAVDAVLDGAIMVSDAEVVEGSRGESLVSVDVRLSRPQAHPVSFDLATDAGHYPLESATAGTDYLPLSLPGQVFAPGETHKRYTVRVLGDAVPESDELFSVKVLNVQGAALARSPAWVRIANDDAQPLANGVSVGPFTSGLAAMRRLFYIDVPAGATSLQMHTTQEGGTLGMVVTPNALPEFGAGDCWGFDWWGESFCTWQDPQPGRWYVMLYAGDYLNAHLTMTYAAAAPPLLSINDASAPEGQAGTKALDFPVTLSAPAPADVQFEVTVEPGTAVAGGDYLLPSPQVHTIPAGQVAVQVPVALVGDTLVEGNESFAVALRNVQGAGVARERASGRIANDDLASLRVDDIVVTEGDTDTTARFTVSLSAPMPSPVAFDIRTLAGSAQAGSDFVARALAGRYLDAGRTRQDFEVTLVGDDAAEASESFLVQVDNVVGAVLADGQASATVLDDDGVAPRQAAAPARPVRKALRRARAAP